MTGISFAAQDEEIVILFENDVHCSVDGYAKLAAMKEELSATADYVGVVSSGDFVQGGSLGVVSKGEYIVNLMNLVGYDAITLGNHEFDYKIERLHELSRMLDATIVCSNFKKTDDKVTSYISQINEEYAKLGERKIGVSEVNLTTVDESGNRIIRNAETNLGDLCADAYREITGADIGMVNGGGIRTNIDIGDITFNEILGVFPFGNKTCVSQVTGQQVVDMLEYGLIVYPEENGSFQHVSGITFDFDPQIEHSIKLDENQEFVSIEGARRVSNVLVLDKETGEYKPIDPLGKYTLASHSYLLMEYGGGATMFKESELLSDTGILDVELLENYITENLSGVVGAQYAQSQNRINVLDEYIPLRKTFEDKGYEVIWNAAEPKRIVVNTNNCTMIFMADTNTVTVDGAVFESDRIAYIEDGKTYISADCLLLSK